MSKSKINCAIDKIKNYGLKNILALRGDSPQCDDEWQPVNGCFNYATDLVRHIRATCGKEFVICVAGYPNSHPEAISYESDLHNLKEKVDAGADFIITQLFFHAETFLKFENDCRNIGITCPILPGILPIQAYQSLRNIVRLSKLEIPTEILKIVEANKDNELAIRQYGIDQAVKICKELLNSGKVFGLHFYTLNRDESTIEILQQLGLWVPNIPISLPFIKPINHKRSGERVRPIFWSNRSYSYIYRTQHWNEFPSLYWSSEYAIQFKELKDPILYYLQVRLSKNELLNMWGSKLESINDISKVFYHHISQIPNNNGVVVKCLPWNTNGILKKETKIIEKGLCKLVEQGVLPINYQQNVNRIESDNEIFGWGISGGILYQKAYLEFFINREHYKAMLKIFDEYSSRISYNIVNVVHGDVSNYHDDDHGNVITWGVFPENECIQSTVVCRKVLKYWKIEAYDLWIKHWGVLYETGSISQRVIQQIHDEYYLVNLVDNNYAEENCLFDLMEKVINYETV